MNKTWNFSSNGDGQAEGFNDAGINHFRTHPVISLARETIQNSIDAALEDKKVIVEFKLKEINTEELLGYEDLRIVFEKCINIENNNKNVESFFNHGLNVLNNKKINIMRISDYNTTGLKGAKNESEGKSYGNWFSLIKSTGNSFKGSTTSAGSYGIGKKAPFVTSDLRTVYYRTVNEDKEIAFQGVSVLMSHPHPTKENTLTRGTGYLGNPEGNHPSFGKKLLNIFDNNRNENTFGSDIFIAAYKYTKNWENQIIRSVITNFFSCIHNDKLEVKVGDEVINKETIEKYFKKIENEDSENGEHFLPYSYYKALTSPQSIKFKENTDIGELELYILEGKDYSKKIAMTRNTGMLIYERDIRKPLKFVGFFTTNDESLNEFLRQTEPPAHDEWNPELCDNNEDEAKQKIRKLNDWIAKKIQSIIDQNSEDMEDIPGLSDYLPNEMRKIDNSNEKEFVRTISIKEKKYSPRMQFQGKYTDSDDGNFDNKSFEDDFEEEENQFDLGENSNMGSEREIKGLRPKVNLSENNTGSIEKNGIIKKDKKKKRIPKSMPSDIRIINKKWFCINEDKNEYLLVLTVNKTTKIRLKLYSIGEDGSLYPFKVLSGETFDSKKNLNITNENTIGPISFESNKKSKFIFKVASIDKLSVEVKLYEDK